MMSFKITKKIRILILIFIMLGLIRLILPSLILQQVNLYLANLSGNYTGHVEDLDLSIWRGAYTLKDTTFSLKNTKEVFLKIKNSDVSIAWRELFRGHILSDIRLNKIVFTYNILSWRSLAEKSKVNIESAEKAGGMLFPILLTSLKIQDSEVQLIAFDDQKNTRNLFITGINGQISDINLARGRGIQPSDFHITGNLPEDGRFKCLGTISMTQQNTSWSTRISIDNLKLPIFNPWIVGYLPLTFKSGNLDLLTKIHGENKHLKGFIKPFIQDLDLMTDNRDFKNLKHFGIETIVAILNFAFKNKSTKTLAFYLPFEKKDKNFDVDYWTMLYSLYENGYIEEIERDFSIPGFTQSKKHKKDPDDFRKKI